MAEISSIAHSLYFAGRFLRNPGSIGAVLPSSRELAEQMLQGIDLGPATPVLELGPGTGAFTAVIAQLVDAGMPVPYLGIDRDRGMYKHLKRRFPKLSFVHGNVSDVRSICAGQGFTSVAVVVCGLPLVLMDEDRLPGLISDVRSCMRPGGVFRAFSYVHCYPLRGAARVRQLLAETFDQSRRAGVVFSNLPPAIVLEGKVSEPATS